MQLLNPPVAPRLRTGSKSEMRKRLRLVAAAEAARAVARQLPALLRRLLDVAPRLLRAR